jgi:hypothetical protein
MAIVVMFFSNASDVMCSINEPSLGKQVIGKISYAITYPGASMQSSDLVHPI